MTGAHVLTLPEGCRVDLERIVSSATYGTPVHRMLGTTIVSIEPDGVTLALPWRDDLAEAPDAGFAPGVISTLLDHACSLASSVAVNGERAFGGTIGLRVDHLARTKRGRPIVIRARELGRRDSVVHVHGEVVHPDAPRELIATGTCTCAFEAPAA